MSINRIKITTIVKILILVFLILAGFFIWKSFNKFDEQKSNQVIVPSANYNSETHVFNPFKNFEMPIFSQERQIYNPIDETMLPFFENIYEPAQTIIQTAPTIPSSPEITTSTPNEIILSLTKDEFHFLYPDTFIKSLVDAQDLFIKNLDTSYEPLAKIETDAQVRLIEEKIVTALISMGMITKEEGDKAITTIHYTLPKLQQVELKNRKFSFSNQYFNFMPFAQANSKKLFLFGLVDKLFSALAPKAEAAYCGACWNQPECFQVGSSSPKPGFNVFKLFCRCTGCYYGQGCLDSCSGGSAIFDPTEFICGCGY